MRNERNYRSNYHLGQAHYHAKRATSPKNALNEMQSTEQEQKPAAAGQFDGLLNVFKNR